jgi:hypothetical protein
MNTIIVIGTIKAALNEATQRGLDVRRMHLNPDDLERLLLGVPKSESPLRGASIVMIRDWTLARGFTRLECVKLPDGLELARHIDELESALSGVARPVHEKPN